MPYQPGLSVRILTHERAHIGRRTVVEALRELVTQEGIAGITVTRAVEGYSARDGIHTTGVVELGDDLPLVVEIVDTAERIERVLPAITSLITEGAMMMAEVRLYGPPVPTEAADG